MIIPTMPENKIFAAEPVTNGPYKDILKGYRGQLCLSILRRVEKPSSKHLFPDNPRIYPSYYLGLLQAETLYKVPNSELFEHIPVHEYDLERIGQAYYLPTAIFCKLPELLYKFEDNIQVLPGNVPVTPDAIEHINETAHTPLFLRENSEIIIGDEAVCDWAISREAEQELYISALKLGKKIDDQRFEARINDVMENLTKNLFGLLSKPDLILGEGEEKIVTAIMKKLNNMGLDNDEIRKKAIAYSSNLISMNLDKISAAT